MAQLGYVLKQDIVKFLDAETLDELTGGRKAIGSNPAVGGEDTIWREVRASATKKAEGYARHWYDVDTETRPIIDYNVAAANTLGERVAGPIASDIYPLYVCIQNAPIGTLLSDTNFYELKDDREPVFLEIVILLLIYSLSRRKNPRQIPEQRQIDYDHAIDQLKDIQKGRIQLEIAERVDVPEDDPGQEFIFGQFDDATQDFY